MLGNVYFFHQINLKSSLKNFLKMPTEKVLLEVSKWVTWLYHEKIKA